MARDPRFERLPCSHTGTYADDCLVQRITAHRCYIVATCDRELRRRVRKVRPSIRCRRPVRSTDARVGAGRAAHVHREAQVRHRATAGPGRACVTRRRRTWPTLCIDIIISARLSRFMPLWTRRLRSSSSISEVATPRDFGMTVSSDRLSSAVRAVLRPVAAAPMRREAPKEVLDLAVTAVLGLNGSVTRESCDDCFLLANQARQLSAYGTGDSSGRIQARKVHNTRWGLLRTHIHGASPTYVGGAASEAATSAGAWSMRLSDVSSASTEKPTRRIAACSAASF